MSNNSQTPNTLHSQDRKIVLVVYVLYMFGLLTSFVSAAIGFLVVIAFAGKAKNDAGRAALRQQRNLFLKALLGVVFAFVFSATAMFVVELLELPESVGEVAAYSAAAIIGLSVIWFVVKSFIGFRRNSRAMIQQRMAEEAKPEVVDIKSEREDKVETQDFRGNDESSELDNPYTAEAISLTKEEIVVVADDFFQLLTDCYEFGDPDYEPSVIYKEAKKQRGYDEFVVDTLLTNLRERHVVVFEQHPGPFSHSADQYDMWRLRVVDSNAPAPEKEQQFDGSGTLSQLREPPTALLEPFSDYLKTRPEVFSAYYLVFSDSESDSFVIGILGEGDVDEAVEAAQELASNNSYTEKTVLVIAIDPEGSGAMTNYFRDSEPFYRRD